MKLFKKLLFELITVFLGVILALYFDNLNENRLQQATINGLMNKIELGTQKNIEALHMQLAQNQKVLDSLIYYKDDPTMSLAAIKSNAKGVRYIQFDMAAWNVLKSSELLVDVDYEVISLLYLLDESISNSETIKVIYALPEQESKRKYVDGLADYIGEIKHRTVLSQEIQKLLVNRKK